MAISRTYDVRKENSRQVATVASTCIALTDPYSESEIPLNIIQSDMGRLVLLDGVAFTARQLESISIYLQNGGCNEVRELREDGLYAHRGLMREWEKIND